MGQTVLCAKGQRALGGRYEDYEVRFQVMETSVARSVLGISEWVAGNSLISAGCDSFGAIAPLLQELAQMCQLIRIRQQLPGWEEMLGI